jgi:hydroxymethylbilane synthase
VSTQTGGRSIWRIATRGSPLALWQAERVAARLVASDVGLVCELVVVRTTGDVSQRPLAAIAGQGVFVKEIQEALVSGRADLAVHSAKDLPGVTPPGLVLACVPERDDPRDAMVGSTFEDLRPGAEVATGSPRRRAQLAGLRPDLTFSELRGNMAARIERSEHIGAGVVAFAALARLGLERRITETLTLSTMIMVPQVGQGALAIECRDDDVEARRVLALIDDAAAHRAVRAERAFLQTLGGGCTLPIGALAQPVAGADPVHGPLVLEGLLASRDGRIILRRRGEGAAPEELGQRVAVDLLDRAGGRSLDDWSSWAPGPLEQPICPCIWSVLDRGISGS